MGDFRLLRLIIGRHAIWLHYTNSPRWNKKRAHFDGYPCHVATSFTSYSAVCEKFRVPVPRTIKNKLKNIWLPLKKNQPKATSFPKIHHQFHAIQTGTELGKSTMSPPMGPHLQEGTSWISWWILMEFGDLNRSMMVRFWLSTDVHSLPWKMAFWIGQSSSLVLHVSP